MIVPPEATINVQNALRDLDARLAKIEGKSSADLSETLDLLRRDVNTALRGKAPNERDNFTGSGAGHGFGLVPSPGPYPGSNRFLAEDGTWEPVLQGVLEAITPGTAGTSVDQATLSLKGSLAVTGALQADSIMARNVSFLNTPYCVVTHSTTQTHTSGAIEAMSFDTDVYDPFNMHSTTSNTTKITIPAGMGGLYYMTACWQNNQGANGVYYGIGIRANGTNYMGYHQGSVSLAMNAVVNTSCVYQLSAGDYVEMTCISNAAAPYTVVNVLNYSPYLSVLRITGTQL